MIYAKGSNSPQSPLLAALLLEVPAAEGLFLRVGCKTPEEDQPGGPAAATVGVACAGAAGAGDDDVADPSGLSDPSELVCGSRGGRPPLELRTAPNEGATAAVVAAEAGDGMSVDEPLDHPGGDVGLEMGGDVGVNVLREGFEDAGGGAKDDEDMLAEDSEEDPSGFGGGRVPVCEGVRVVGVAASGVTALFAIGRASAVESSSKAKGSNATVDDADDGVAAFETTSLATSPPPPSCPLPTSVAKSTSPERAGAPPMRSPPPLPLPLAERAA